MYYTLFQDEQPRMDLVDTRLLSIGKQLGFIGKLMKRKNEITRIEKKGKDYTLYIGVRGAVNPRITMNCAKQ